MLRGLAIGLSRQLASRAPAWQQVTQRAASSAITGAPKVIGVAQVGPQHRCTAACSAEEEAGLPSQQSAPAWPQHHRAQLLVVAT